MRRVVLFGMAAAVATACSSDSMRTPTQPESISIPLQVAQHEGARHNHTVHLSGDQEPSPVPPAPSPQDSKAQGQAIFQIAEDDLSFDYKLIAANIENVVQAHIHRSPGMNGNLHLAIPECDVYRSADRPTGHDGVLAGIVTSGAVLNVRTVLPSAVCPGGVANFADALRQIRSGNAYVNIHTNDNVAPANSGPGDFPGGEVRGQFEVRGDQQ